MRKARIWVQIYKLNKVICKKARENINPFDYLREKTEDFSQLET